MTLRLVLAVVTLGAVPLEGQVTDLDRFQFFTACAPVSVLVSVDQKNEDLEELTEQSVLVAVSSRLRAARLHTDRSSYPILVVRVSIVRLAFHVELRFFKTVYDPVSGQTSGSSTWINSTTGTHGRDASYVRSFVAEKMDLFLDEYLRVNTEACDSARPEAREGRRGVIGEVRWSGRVH